MSALPNEFQVTAGDADTGLRVRRSPDRTTHERRISFALLLGIAAAVSMVLLAVRLGEAVKSPRAASSVTVATSAPRPPESQAGLQHAGIETTKTLLAWSGVIALCVLLPTAGFREKRRHDFAKIQLRKAAIMVPNERGQFGIPLEHVEGNPSSALAANTQHQLNELAANQRPLVSSVGNYAPHYVNQGHVRDSMDPLENDPNPPPANPFTVLEIMKAGVPNREEILVGMSDEGPEKVQLIQGGCALIYGRSQFGKSTVAKSQAGQILYSLGDVYSIDPDREHGLGFSKGLGYGMGSNRDVTQFFALPPARTVEEIGLVVENVQARLDRAEETGVPDHCLLVIDEVIRLFKVKPKEFIPKDLREAVIGLMSQLLLSPKQGVYLAAICHLTDQNSSGGNKIRPLAKTIYLFNMEQGQARTAINNNNVVVPNTGELGLGQCFLRIVVGDENRFLRVRTPMCPDYELEEMVTLLTARREDMTTEGLVVPDRELWTPRAEALTDGIGEPALDSHGHQIAIEPSEPPPDPDYPEITVDGILQAKFRLFWTDGQIVDGFWPEKYHGNHGGRGRQDKIKIVSDTVAKYAPGWLARQATAEAQAMVTAAQVQTGQG